MKKIRASFLLVCAVSVAGVVPCIAAELTPPPAAPSVEVLWYVTKVAATPLEQIPLYSLNAASPVALRSLDAEVDRLYRHALTLPSGFERRAFEGRIYRLEKQLRPLADNFNASGWEALRLAVKTEWLDVQSSLALADTVAQTPALASEVGSIGRE